MKKKIDTLKENEQFVKTYDDSKYPKPSVTVDMAIFGTFSDEEGQQKLKLLLIRRGAAPFKDCYALPGGFVNLGESIEEAAKRELKEETNLECNCLEQFGTYSDPDRDPRRWVISNGFLAVVDGRQERVQSGDDAADAKWFDISFLEKDGEWHLQLTHEEEKLSARLEEVTASWNLRKRFKTIESNDIAFDHQLIIADAITTLQFMLPDAFREN